MQMKYSIIIPVFNSETTLRRCLDSLLADPRTDAELLLIDDGSTDRSPAICREYEGRDPRVRVLEKAHEGVSAARNRGLEQASGTYILFADSDDYAEPDYFEKLDRTLRTETAELVSFSYRLVGTRTSTVRMPEKETSDPVGLADQLSLLLRKQQLNALWSKAFLRRVIDRYGLRFDESLCIDEDVNFILSYVMHIDRLLLSPEILYNTCLTNPESLTRRKRDYLCEQLHAAGIARKAILEHSELPAAAKRRINRALSWLYFRGAYSSAAETLKYSLSGSERRDRIRTICDVFADGTIKPRGLRSEMISVPIYLRMTRVIDCAAIRAVRRRML